MASLTLRGVTKWFGQPGATIAAVNRVDCAVSDGEFVAVLGPSGCGKTTLLRLIAGFETLDDGSITLGQATVSAPGVHVPPERRRVGVVFQSYALWPHMTVKRNVGYPLEVRGLKAPDYDRRVAAALATVGLSGFETRRPAELSGGQRQRVALARCLVMEPSLVLLDEPLANLDVHLRAALQDEFTVLHRATRATMLYVTHDQAEAMALADRIVVMEAGRIVQVAPPAALYREPATPMVARFVGRGAVVSGTVLEPARGGVCPVEVCGYRTQLRARPNHPAGHADMCLRTEDMRLVSGHQAGIRAIVRRAIYEGGRTAVEFEAAESPESRFTLLLPSPAAPAPGAGVRLAVDDGWVIPV